MIARTSLAVVLSVLAGTTHSTAVVVNKCAIDPLAALMQVLPAYAAPFCASAVSVTIKTPTATVTATPTM